MDDKKIGFPIPLIGVAILAAFATIWLQYPRVVLTDIFAMAAGQSLAFVGIAYIAFAFYRRMNAKTIEPERTEKARRVAWITLAVIAVANVTPVFTS